MKYIKQTIISSLITLFLICSVSYAGTLLFPSQGGTGQDTSGWTGYTYITNGTWGTSTPAGGGGGGLFSTSTGFSYLTDTASDLVLGDNATATAPFFFDVSTGDFIITGDMTAISYSGDGSNLTGVGEAAATALTISCKAAENITKGQVVYISGATGSFPEVSLADNTNSAKHAFVGVAAETKTTGQTILVRVRGELSTLDTSAWVDGDALYLSTNGDMVTTTPTTGAVSRVGFVSYSHANQGKMVIMHHAPHAIMPK